MLPLDKSKDIKKMNNTGIDFSSSSDEEAFIKLSSHIFQPKNIQPEYFRPERTKIDEIYEEILGKGKDMNFRTLINDLMEKMDEMNKEMKSMREEMEELRISLNNST